MFLSIRRFALLKYDFLHLRPRPGKRNEFPRVARQTLLYCTSLVAYLATLFSNLRLSHRDSNQPQFVPLGPGSPWLGR